MIRLGLCCVFHREPIRFRRATAAAMSRFAPAERRARLAAICMANAGALSRAIAYCGGHGIGCFRVNSQILPLKTHPRLGYTMDDLPGGDDIRRAFRECGRQARGNGLRLTFHPDQFVVLNSPTPAVVKASIAELVCQAEVAGWIGADVINIHGGGGYGDKPAALERLQAAIMDLPAAIRRRLALENDERVYTPSDLLPICRTTGVPLVYDVHHHRCNPDGLTIRAATSRATATWNREPLFHISSPRAGWRGPRASRHHEFIMVRDFPCEWLGLSITVEVEAKAKEMAVLRLARALRT